MSYVLAWPGSIHPIPPSPGRFFPWVHYQTSTPTEQYVIVCRTCSPMQFRSNFERDFLKPGYMVSLVSAIVWQGQGHVWLLIIALRHGMFFLKCWFFIVTMINGRKFRSQISDNMDRWKAEQVKSRDGKRSQRREEKKKKEDHKRESLRRKKIQGREKVGKSRRLRRVEK